MLSDRFAITKEQMNHLQEEFASLAEKSKKEISEKDEVRSIGDKARAHGASGCFPSIEYPKDNLLLICQVFCSLNDKAMSTELIDTHIDTVFQKMSKSRPVKIGMF